MTKIRYHLNAHLRPAPCEATKRPCPLGGYHFSTPEEAEFHALDMNMKSKHGLELVGSDGYACRCGWEPTSNNMDAMFDVQDHAREGHTAEVESAREAMHRAQERSPAKTLAQLRLNAEGPVVAGADGAAPEGFFTATTKVLGIPTTYLLAGSPGNEEAQIAGRIEYGEMSNAVYRGNQYKGGNLVGFNRTGEEAFKRIAQVHQDFSIPYAP